MKKVISIFILLLVVLGVTTGCSISSFIKTATNPPQTSQQPQQPQQSQQPAQTQAVDIASSAPCLNWVDLSSDIVSPQGLVTDGKPDGHFHVTMVFPEPAKIKYIIMRYTEFNEHVQWAWAYNKTIPTIGSPLAVFQKDTLVLQGTDIGFECSGNVDLDLYIPELNNENGRDTFIFQKGQNISIQINYVTKSGQEQEFDLTTTVLKI
ncbi:MAG: hypothetical protein ACYDEJ_13985 [Desulfitobacteriaceae bacterium]